MNRRDVFPIIGAGTLAAQHHKAGPPESKPWLNYTPRFFTADEFAIVGALMERIIPHEEHSPGALDVGAPYFIDTVLYFNTALPREAWREGLAAMAKENFAKLTVAGQEALLTRISAAERAPSTVLERFFPLAKRATAEAWCMSADGRARGLGYTGNTAIKEFLAP